MTDASCYEEGFIRSRGTLTAIENDKWLSTTWHLAKLRDYWAVSICLQVHQSFDLCFGEAESNIWLLDRLRVGYGVRDIALRRFRSANIEEGHCAMFRKQIEWAIESIASTLTSIRSE